MSDPRPAPDPGDRAAPAQVAELERIARDLAVEAGRIVRDERPRDLAVSTKSSRTDVVTVMDAAAETHLRERLAQLRPQDAVYGEEGGARAGRSDLTWVLDPIDGTVNYLYGIEEYAVSVAVVVGDPGVHGAWRPVAGAVAHPAAGLVYSAHEGGGARVSASQDWSVLAREAAAHGVTSQTGVTSRDLATTRPDTLELALLGTGFGYRPEVRRDQARRLVHLLPRVRDIRRGGSAALDLCAVAAGRLDAYYERGVHSWDIAAGWLLVTEAGGIVSGVEGSRPDAHGTVAAGPGVHAELRELLRGLPE